MAKETATALFEHMFQSSGFPEDIFSDVGGVHVKFMSLNSYPGSSRKQTLSSTLLTTTDGLDLHKKNYASIYPAASITPGILNLLKNSVTYQLSANYCIASSFHASHLKPVYTSITMRDCPTPPPPPTEVDGSPSYLLCSIINSRRTGHLQYLVECEGYGPKEQ